MEYLCAVVLLLSAVAAHAYPWRQWQQGDTQFPPFGRPQQSPDRHPTRLNGRDPWMQDGFLPPFGDQPIGGGGENSRTIGGGPMWQGWNMRQTDSPGWPNEDQMPPWYPNRPSGGPGSGDTQRLMGGPNGETPQSGGLNGGTPESGGSPDYPDRGYKRGSDFGYPSNGPGLHPGQRLPRGPESRWGRPAGRAGGWRPNMRNLDARPDRNPLRHSAVPSGAGRRPPFDDTFFVGRPLQPEMVVKRSWLCHYPA